VDPRAALSALRARWWVLVLTTALTVGLGVALTFLQPRAYVATSTYVVAPTEGLGSDVLSAISVISRQTEIAETFAQIAMSGSVAEAVHAELELAADAPSVTIESQVRPGTTVLEVTARSSDPQLAERYANATGDVLPDFLEGINDTFRLVLLDAANDAIPVPSGLILNVALGLVVGLALGAGLVLAVRWLRGLGRPQPPEIVDSESVDYNRAYFGVRLRQALGGVRRTRRPLALAVLRTLPVGQMEAVPASVRLDMQRIVTAFMEAENRGDDLAARIDEATFALVLRGRSSQDVEARVEAMRSAIEDRSRLGFIAPVNANVRCVSAVIDYAGGTESEFAFLDRAERLVGSGLRPHDVTSLLGTIGSRPYGQ
jgi:capsular polysaccharide biosynthesis protein/GGDEF domain-containing protein